MNLRVLIGYSVILFVCGGVLNYYITLYSPLKINPSLIGILVIILVSFFNIKNSSNYIRHYASLIYFGLLFLCWAIFGYLISPSIEYGLYKLISLASNFLFFILMLVVIDKSEVINFIATKLLYFSIILGLLYLLLGSYFSPFRREAADFASNSELVAKTIYLSTAQLFSFIVIFVAVLNIQASFSKSIIISFAYLILAVSGARSAFVLTVVFHIVAIMLREERTNFKIFYALIPLLSWLVYIWESLNIGELIDHLSGRFATILESDEGGRFAYWSLLLRDSENWLQILFGHGLGAYGILRKGFDTRDYPHNIILDLFYELGLLGLILGSIFLVKIYRFCLLSSLSWQQRLNISLLGVLPLVELMKSHTYAEYRVFWVSLAFMLVLTKVMENQKLGTEVQRA